MEFQSLECHPEGGERPRAPRAHEEPGLIIISACSKGFTPFEGGQQSSISILDLGVDPRPAQSLPLGTYALTVPQSLGTDRFLPATDPLPACTPNIWHTTKHIISLLLTLTIAHVHAREFVSVKEGSDVKTDQFLASHVT